MRIGLCVLLVGSLVLLCGCTGSTETRRFQTRVIRNADADTVLAVAEKVLQREFGRLTVNRAGRTIVSDPVAYDTRNDSGTARDLYGGISRMRQIADMSVLNRGGDGVVRLRIEVQRQDTQRTEVQQDVMNRLSDSPAYTPIERDGATTEEQNTVWTFYRRNNALERELLSEVQDAFGEDAPPLPEPIRPEPEELDLPAG